MKLLSLARDLRRRKARERQALFVVEGVRAAEELLRSPLTLRGALVAPQLADAPRGAALQQELERRTTVEHVSHRDFASAAETESPQGVLVVAEVPARSLADVPDGDSPVLILDGVQDPGNVGAILRTAAALGARATIALPGTVDLWNAKVVRAAVGAHFNHHAFSAAWADVLAWLRQSNVTLWTTAAVGIPLNEAPAVRRVAIALGNEGAGVSADVVAAAERCVGIPLQPGAESLNVAVTTGILLYVLGSR